MARRANPKIDVNRKWWDVRCARCHHPMIFTDRSDGRGNYLRCTNDPAFCLGQPKNPSGKKDDPEWV